jgi:hypothetical protein
LSGEVAHEIQGPEESLVPPLAGQRGEVVMTHFNRSEPVEHSEFNSLVVNLFTGAVLILAGVLTFAQFVNI